MTAASPHPGTDRAADPAGASLGYADAVDELEAILAGLEGADVDVDVLAVQVRRAAELLAVCRRRIDDARVEVELAVRGLADGPVGPAGAEAADDERDLEDDDDDLDDVDDDGTER